MPVSLRLLIDLKKNVSGEMIIAGLKLGLKYTEPLLRNLLMFQKFARIVNERFDQLSQSELYVTGVARDSIWETYLNAFPEGTNPIYKTNTEHDCSCCRQFIKNVGNIVDCNLISLWDIPDLPAPYDTVARKLSAFVKSHPIRTIFRIDQIAQGAVFTRQEEHKWFHFHATVARRHYTPDVAAVTGEANSIVGVFRRGLEELKPEAVATVLELIESNSIYKGAEFQTVVRNFQNLQQEYLQTTHRNTFVWRYYNQPASRIKNSVIGSLIEDLSDDKDLEDAVRSYEAKVAPENYKRPKSLITPRMIQDATETIEKLGLQDALQRRYARIDDVSVNNVLFVDNAVRGQMKDGGITELLMPEAKVPRPKLTTIPISMDDFRSKVLPEAKTLHLLIENSMMGNFASLTAPAVADSGRLLKWNNDFAWAYDGNVTDSIKQRVKKAGGNVDAKLRVSLSWFNTDDLDIHVIEPNGNHIYFASKGGKLDVDMNVNSPVRDAVENVSWSCPLDGRYLVKVNNYCRRESIDVGFVIEMENDGVIETFSYPKVVSGTVDAITFTVKNGKVVEVKPDTGMQADNRQQEKWGVKTNSLVRVDSLMLSPNYWDANQVGNKHWFFMLQDCKNPEPIRGLYNEFLHSDLEKHRKVFEVLGDKMKCPVSDNQLSGVGFSSTRKDQVKVVVNSGRSYHITF